MLRALLEASSEGLLALDEHGTIVEANHASALIVGHDRRSLVGKPLAAVVALADRRRYRRELARLEAGAPKELRLQLHDDPKPWRVTLHLLPRVLPRTVAVSITREGGATLPPVRPARRTEYFMLRFPHAVVALGDDLRVVFANARARSLLGRDSVRPGLPFAPGSPEVGALAQRLVDVPAPLGTTLVDLPDGRVLRVSGIAATAEEPAVLLLEDTTSEVQRNRVMRDFVRNAAHQLRTPLTGITAGIEALQSGAKERPADRDRFLAHLETHAERLSRVARALLVLARAQAGEHVRVEFVEIEPLFAALVAAAEPRDGVAVRCECPPRLAALAAADLLHEALAALVTNAVAHTLDGQVLLSAVERDGQVTLSVSDSGSGVPPELRERIFEPFFRVGDDGAGYGLGLAIAAQAVEAMGGAIDVSGAPGVGTTFTVTLRSATVVR